MTNTIFFYNTIRDDVSTTTEDGETSSTADSYTHQQAQDLNSEDDNNDAKDVAPTPPGEGGKLEYSNSKEFSFNELKTATRNFHHELDGPFGIGRVFKSWIDENKPTATNPGKLDGPFGIGRVFKGWIDENKLTATNPGKGIPVAIKRLEHGGLLYGGQTGLSFKGLMGYQAEVNYLGRLYHPNLLRLLGYCLDNEVEEHLLVYEFMPRGSLENHLFIKVSTPLSWSVRMKIALGAAKGLAFLHSAPINVIHRDFISSNILLDMDYNAKLSGFKLAMDGSTDDKSDVSLSPEVMGTYGYAAPEYIATGHLTAKCDVYAFGVVLLEMLSGRRAIDSNRPSEERFLVKWAEPYLKYKRKVYRVADSRLEGQYSLKGFQKAANLALKCLSQKSWSRPNMDNVVKVLREL